MKKPIKKDSKYKLLGFFFYAWTYKKDLKQYLEYLETERKNLNLKKSSVSDTIDVKHIKDVKDVREKKECSQLEIDYYLAKISNSNKSWYEKQAEIEKERLVKMMSSVSISRKTYQHTGRRIGKTYNQIKEQVNQAIEMLYQQDRVKITFQDEKQEDLFMLNLNKTMGFFSKYLIVNREYSSLNSYITITIDLTHNYYDFKEAYAAGFFKNIKDS